MTTATMVVIIIAIVAIAAAVWMFTLVRKTRQLRNRFGPEYDRAVEREHGRVTRAESLLEKRQERVSKLNIRSLSRQERERFAADWQRVQERFVDDPRDAVIRADAIVCQAMQARNYPMADFEQRAADISVEHPRVVEDYRAAHAIATRDPQRDVSTEELRRAMQHYRSLFEEVAEMPKTHREEVYR